jgi:hypothetical protein
MPPFENTPGSFFAAIGSGEYDEMCQRVDEGELFMVEPESGDEETDRYAVFSPREGGVELVRMAAEEYTLMTGKVIMFYPSVRNKGH